MWLSYAQGVWLRGGREFRSVFGCGDPDAAAAVPGVASSAQKNAAGAGRSEVTKNASSLGEVFVARFGGCAVGRSDT